MDHSGGVGHLAIFETMVFPKPDDVTVLDARRYATEKAAKAGHVEMVKKWSTKVLQN